MKRILLTLAVLLIGVAPLWGQVPQGINYQAVLVDQNGQPMPGYDVAGLPIPEAAFTLTFKIYSADPAVGGALLYAEEHLGKRTDEFGMYDAIIGLGTKLPSSGMDFNAIPWSNGQQKWLMVTCEMTDKDFTATTAQALWTVPYAFAADHAVKADLATDVINNDDADADPTNELQNISISGNVVSLTNGGTITLPIDEDPDSTNEIQTIVRVGDSLFLSHNGGMVSVLDADSDPTNELQVLSLVNDTVLSLSNGNTVIIPTSVGPIGPIGLSAYDVWLAAGNSGSQTDFLNSLVGPVGAQGNQGIAGPAGMDGKTIITGSGAPTAALPANPNVGDYYLDTVTYRLYGPFSAATAWNTSVSLVGPT
jgi:hypothetical protein